MQSQKLLTIAIPTWNRSALLDELLLELISQITTFHLENSIEIVVSDNNSTDNTSIICEAHVQNYNFFKYNRNSRNLGAKINVIKALCLARKTKAEQKLATL